MPGAPSAATPCEVPCPLPCAAGATASVDLSDLTLGPYRWRTRVRADDGTVIGRWVGFGGNTEADVDFILEESGLKPDAAPPADAPPDAGSADATVDAVAGDATPPDSGTVDAPMTETGGGGCGCEAAGRRQGSDLTGLLAALF